MADAPDRPAAVAEPGSYAFLSYSGADRAVVTRLRDRLSAAAIPVAWDEDLQVGENWEQRLNDAAVNAGVVIVVWSEASASSSFVLREATRARDAGKLLPISLGGMGVVPGPFDDLVTLSLSGWDGSPDDERVERLITAIRERLGLRTTAAPEAARTSRFVVVDPSKFSSTVRDIRNELTGSVTASVIAATIQKRHPEYAGGAFGAVALRRGVGRRATIGAWLARVARLYDEDEVARSKHKVIDGRLLLAGLAQLDGILAEDLDRDGVTASLTGELEVHPSRSHPPAAETDVGFAADMVRDGAAIGLEHDLLGIEDDVRTLCRLVLARSTHPPLAIGLFGDWGTGKSFFLQRMRTVIDEMTDEAAKSAAGFTTCEHVVQVTFNAWHYLDADLWTSIAHRLYREMVGGPSGAELLRRGVFEKLASTSDIQRKAAEQREAATEELADLERRLTDAEAKLARSRANRLTVGDAVDVVSTAVSGKEGLGTERTDAELGQLAADARFGQGLVRSVVSETGAKAKVLAGGAVILVLAGVAWIAAGGLAPLAALLPSAVVSVAAWLGGFKDAFRDVRVRAVQARRLQEEATSQLRHEVVALRKRQEDAKATQDAADATLTEIRAGSLVRRYLDERLQSAAFRERLGVVSLVREDLERLTDLLDPGSPESLDAKIDRIVLYVDDLDRCPPDRVVEVLQAVHLLLAFPIFVVVVAVDPRWLLTSLQLHYRELLRADDGKGDALLQEWELTPTNYLEKIFQLPLRLREMDDEGYRRLVAKLADVRPEREGGGDDRGAGAPRPSPRDETATTATTAKDVDEGAETRVPLRVLEAPIDGTVLQLRFCAGGGRLVLITTEGVWRWDRGRTTLTRELTGPVALAAVSLDGEVTATVDDRRVLHVIDMPTRARREIPLEEDVTEVAVAAIDRVGALTTSRELLEFESGRSSVEHGLGALRALAFNPDGAAVYTLDQTLWVMAETPSWAEGTECYEISARGEILVSANEYLRRIAVPGTGPVPTPVAGALDCGSVRTKAARSREGWWIVRDRLHVWPDEGGELETLPFAFGEDINVAADHSATPVVAWGNGGFEVFDRLGIHYREPDVAVDLAAVSPLGSLVATVGGGKLSLWRITGVDTPESPSQLELEPEEAAFLAQLAPLVSTPRMAKRVVNVYRLLRASAFGRSRLGDPSTGDYRVAMLLLVLAVAWPDEAAVVFDTLAATAGETWPDVAKEVRGKLNGDGREAMQHVIDLSADPTPSDVELFVEWAEQVRRYHVHRGE